MTIESTETDAHATAAPGSASGTAAYTSNATLAGIAERLTAGGPVLVLTHAKPDGDAVGSVLGLARALNDRGVRAMPVFCPPFNTRFVGLFDDRDGAVIAEDESFFASETIHSVETIAVLDTGAFAQLGPAASFVRDRADRTVIVDHHRGGDDGMARLRHVDPSAAAASQLVAQLAAMVLDGRGVASLPSRIASPLYLGLASDTGWFKHPSVTPAVFRVAADLLEAGADHNTLYLSSEQSDPPARLELMRRALDSLRLVAADRGAVMCLSSDDFRESGAAGTESGGLVDLPKTIGTIEVCALLTQADRSTVKLSMRSKAGRLDIDVNAIAQTWGGGGHKHAAGAKLDLPLAIAVREVEAAITDAITAAEREHDPKPSPASAPASEAQPEIEPAGEAS